MEVTFLNKIARLYLPGGSDEQGRGLVSVEKVLALAVRHFEVKIEFMASLHLYNLSRQRVVWEPSVRPGHCFYLFFVRSG